MNWYGTDGAYTVAPETCARNVAAGSVDAPLCNWHDLQDAGLVADRAAYLAAVRRTAVYLAETGIAEALSAKDTALMQMVRTLDELDHVINLMTERVSEWHQATTVDSSRKYHRATPEKMLAGLAKTGSGSLKPVAREILSMTAVRTRLMKDVSAEALQVIPNMSALVGGLVAARLVSRAGGLTAISRMPGSSIQVLGAESALFAHIRTGSPSPKHGLLFQHRRVHNAPKDVRGKVSRQIAAKLAAASRIDLFRGELDREFIDVANARIDALMEEAK
ncbi:MAG TPA: RNA-processing protein [Methanocorpusculum sp.]|nr:RNA-processing protein [Methanocorpusculum sp.]